MNARSTSAPAWSPRPHFPLNHIAAFFRSPEEEYDALLPFIQTGIERGDKEVHIVDLKLYDEHIRQLQNGSIDTKAAEARGQLEFLDCQKTYLHSDRFDSSAMVQIIEGILTTGHSQGFPCTDIVGHVEWLLQHWPEFREILVYESRLTDLLSRSRDTVICVYTTAQLEAHIFMDILRSHPAVLISGVLHRNPFFVPPDELLEAILEEERSPAHLLEPVMASESRHVRRAISDLVALSTLSAAWIGREPGQIADDILSILMHCPRIDTGYLRLRTGRGVEVSRMRAEAWPQFQEWLRNIDHPPPGSEPVSAERRIELSGDGKHLYLLQIPIGIDAEAGWIAVGSTRPDFPNEMDLLLLTIAANQGLVAFQNARLLHERELAATQIEVLKEEVDRTGTVDELVGSSPAIRRVVSGINKVAPTDSTVLITGETGTGKELAARAVHKRSRRAQQPFIGVNCAGLPASLIASELFGHEEGAFTGAERRRLGRFELADHGTLFLDEIGELSLETQAALLRALQERVIERLGGGEPIPVDVRLIAASNRDLQRAVAEGTFRSDLYYRIHVFPIEMPPLRERKEDIPVLTRQFIDRYAAPLGKKIRTVDKATLELFQSYDWPGNIREMQNVVERSLILSEGHTFSVDVAWLATDRSHHPQGSLLERIVAYERELIEHALRDSKGKVAGRGGAASRLGIPSTTLESRIKALHINKNRFRP
jgi:transcriptional regulator with GAF, ATPase, and Fis domain